MYEGILEIIAGLAGLGGFVSMLVNILKMVGVVKDGTSDKWFEGINLLAFAVVAVIFFLNVNIDWAQVDDWLKVLSMLFGLVIQLLGGRVTYNTLRGIPVIGYSFKEE